MKNSIFQGGFLFCFFYTAILLNADLPPEKSFDQSLMAIHHTSGLSTVNKSIHKVVNKIDQDIKQLDQKVTSALSLKKKKHYTDSTR